VAVSEFELRRGRVGAGLAARKLDAILISGLPNVRYLTGFTGDNALLLVVSGKSILITDPRYEIQAATEVSCRVKITRTALTAEALAAIRRLGLYRIGYEPARMNCAMFESLKARLPLRAALEPVPGWIEDLRMVKSEAEIERIRRSVELNSKAFEQAVRHARAGMREQDLAAELEFRMRRLGSEKPAFETIVAGGARSALPHGQPGSRRFESGDLIVVDMGAMLDGYASDMTRMLHIGAPRPKVKRIYRAVFEAQLAALAAVRAGAITARVDAAARGVLKKHGFEKAFVHSTGHGLGLEIHEPPRVGRRDKTRLLSGMTITIEPGAYLEGFGGVRIEDTVVVRPTGCDILTPTAKHLREL